MPDKEQMLNAYTGCNINIAKGHKSTSRQARELRFFSFDRESKGTIRAKNSGLSHFSLIQGGGKPTFLAGFSGLKNCRKFAKAEICVKLGITNVLTLEKVL